MTFQRLHGCLKKDVGSEREESQSVIQRCIRLIEALMNRQREVEIEEDGKE